MKIQAIPGFKDILPEEARLWRHIEQTAREVFSRFAIREIRLPILEKTELFARSIGEATDIVEKEMYTFADKGITMRPEATASLLRAFVEHGMHVQQPVHRLFTIGPMFRHERPQKGRLRQFHQIDVEIIGAREPQIDAELMAMGHMLLKELGVSASLEINSLGCPQCRPAFRQRLIDYLASRRPELCRDCQRRLETNPLRVLDCKHSTCRELVQEAPSILDALCGPCQEHLQNVEATLDLLDVPFSRNRFMVRGLDYYTRTTFEFLTDQLGAQAAVGAGGRYDGLIHQLGGPDLPGIGFALGMERLALLMRQGEENGTGAETCDCFVAALGERAREHATILVHELRQRGCRALMDFSGRSLKAQMKQSARQGSRYTLIIGDNELDSGQAVLRDMNSQKQESFELKTTPQQQAQALRDKICQTSRETSSSRNRAT